ncbi:MAG: sensor histidine kinase, partial [Deltaproteobacteria bacterium]|nr:sensor histidine kinase [Deltaproteobacteria bacterium]
DRGGHPVVVLDDRELQLSPEARLRLFDPRVEVDQGRTMRLDISLALAHQLLSRNGARVTVESDEGGGTRCSIMLPSAEA